jgi:hydroxymethylpyrimidine pyrophosphatase-like HAD family hydrolase
MAEATTQALQKLRASGRKLVLATGERLQELKDFPNLNLFDCVVAENGGLLYWPRSGREKPLGPRPPARLLRELKKRKVKPLNAGRVIVSTERPHDDDLHELLPALGLDYAVFLNRHEVMALPSSLDKGQGLKEALREFNIRPSRAVAVGDGENDRQMLHCCGFGVAVNNAVPLLKECADHVTRGRYGKGVVQIVDQLLADDLRSLQKQTQAR